MLININKPAGITSHDVVDEVRKITGEKRVGHAGTLDPFATGVLVVGVGREDTKKLGNIMENAQKEYIAMLELGKTSSTGDPDGEIREGENKNGVTKEKVQKVFPKFLGEIEQTSPLFSAVKVHGIRAHKLARQGKIVQMPRRIVSISSIKLLAFQPPFVKLKIICSSGTYIRALAKDIGEALGTGAYLTELTRIRVGQYQIENSITLEKFQKTLS